MKKSSFTFVSICLCSCPTIADEFPAKDNAEQSEMLEEILVKETPFSQLIGTQKLNEKQIANLPSKNGNISELLRYNPNVKFSNMSDTSTSAGEIAPNEVSIHGEKFYNNNYTIDGLSNNDNLNPVENNQLTSGGNSVSGYSPNDLPSGGTQSLWLDKNLFKNVEVFDSNISAKYGNFTGGVINAELKDPDFEKASGKVFYRTTRDNWAEFYLPKESEDSYNKAENLGDQPKFTKHQYGLTINYPFSEKFSTIFHYNHQESQIPYHHAYLNEWNTQKRINDTYYLRSVYLPDNGDVWKATIIYSPHKSIYFKKNIKNGKFSNTGGGIVTNIQWDKDLTWGRIESIIGYKVSGNKIEHSGQSFSNYSYTGSVNNTQGFCSNATCKSAQIGGYGTYLTEKESWQIKQDYTLNSIETFGVEHLITFGWEIDLAKAKYERKQDLYLYQYTNDDLKQYILYPSKNVSAKDNSYAFYLEDTLKWKNLTTSLGLRFDRSQFIGKNNIAPRLSASYDLFGNQQTQLFAGLNRYYSDSILSYKLREKIGANTVCQIRNSRCVYKPNISYDISNLKTPYSDERVLGLSQTLFDTQFIFKWVNRQSYDQFTKSKVSLQNGEKTYYMNNNGRSNSNAFTLEIRPKTPYKFQYATVNWNLGAQISKSNTNYSTYENQETGIDYDKAIINGKLSDINQLPTTDYNTPWSAFLKITTQFPKLNLNWEQAFNYSAGYRGYTTTRGVCPGAHPACGDFDGSVLIYDEYKQGSYFMIDWNFNYKLPIYKEQYIELSLDINNVLNRKVIANSSRTTTYKMGRNFWLGMSYNW